MESILRFDTIAAFNAITNQQTFHPLVSVIHMDQADLLQHRRVRYDFYVVFFKESNCGDLRYGCKNYDYQEGTLVFLEPGQAIGSNSEEYFQPQGYALIFHPELIHGTSLGRHISDYTFFSYEVNEALHVSDSERQIVLDCFSKIDYELKNAADKHSKKLIVANIELFLDYCLRFFERQFTTRNHIHKSLLEKFEELLNNYFSSEKPQVLGSPTVGYCASQLHLSKNYFGDLIKKETGKSAQEYIHLKIIEIAKKRILGSDKSLNEIAYELGFRYSQHFSRFFKQHTGQSPNEYRVQSQL